jgi:hypothetical protein
MRRSAGDVAKTVLQAMGIVGLVVIGAIVVHKGFVDISALARQHSGSDFWIALVRYLFKNVAGGAS